MLSNILPAEVRKLWDCIAECDLAEACRQHLRLFPLFKAIFVETNPIPIKAAMAMAGMMREELRPPLGPLSKQHRAMLAGLLRQFGVAVKG